MNATEGSAGPEPKLVDAGGWLRMAREQAGLSIDAVAQQLKLAPRQVQALEDGDYARLPGRTFVRGFVRNYARLMRLDPEAVVAALPGADAAPALEGPAIGSATRPMGELPVTQGTRAPSWSRWAIPAALVAFVALGAIYELKRRDGAGTDAPPPVAKPAPAEPIATAPAGPPGGTALPNPVAGGPATTEPVPAPPPAPAESSPVAPSASGTIGTVPPVAPTPAPADAAAPMSPAPGEATLVVRYNQNAWTQVKDASGQTILITTGTPGGAQTISGRPPFEVVIGNASETSITWRGQPFDLAPHIKGNVARVRLP